MGEREQTTLRLPAELMAQLRAEAQKRGMSTNALILTILSGARNHPEGWGHWLVHSQKCDEE